jgi:hypothetical protein
MLIVLTKLEIFVNMFSRQRFAYAELKGCPDDYTHKEGVSMVRGKIVRAELFADKGYGFVLGEDGNTYFLHVYQQHEAVVDMGGVRFGELIRFDRELGEYPQDGDEIVFEVKPPVKDGGQPQASPWTYAEELEPPTIKLVALCAQCLQLLGYVPMAPRS